MEPQVELQVLTFILCGCSPLLLQDNLKKKTQNPRTRKRNLHATTKI